MGASSVRKLTFHITRAASPARATSIVTRLILVAAAVVAVAAILAIDLGRDNTIEAASETLVPVSDKASSGVWQAAPGFEACGSSGTTCAEHIDDDIDTSGDGEDIRITPSLQSAESVDFELTDMPFGGTVVTQIEVRYKAGYVSAPSSQTPESRS